VAVTAIAVVCLVGIGSAIATKGTGYRTEDVRRLKAIAVAARGSNQYLCTDDPRWPVVLAIVAPDLNLTDCGQSAVPQLQPDANGLPVMVQ